MSAGQIDFWLKEIADSSSGLGAIVLFGGEPTLKWDLVDHTLHVRARSPRLSETRLILFSNGILLSKDSIEQLVEQNAELFLSYDGGSGNSRARYGRRTDEFEFLLSEKIDCAMSRGLALTVVLSLGQHNLRNALAEMKCMYAHFGVKKFKINNIRRRRFCSAPLVWDQCREVAYQWAVANDIDLAWAAYDDFGSASPTWYISSRSSRYVEPFEKGHWELVQW